MDRETYDNKAKALNIKHEAERNNLQREFAFTNNSVKAGDIVTDHTSTIRVEQIKWCKTVWGASGAYKYPSCVYCGQKLTKEGKPFKNNKTDKVYQCNVEKHQKGLGHN